MNLGRMRTSSARCCNAVAGMTSPMNLKTKRQNSTRRASPMSEGEKVAKPRTERVKRCQWPTKCVLEARFSIIDFGFRPPTVWQLCKGHAETYKKLERASVIMEPLKP